MPSWNPCNPNEPSESSGTTVCSHTFEGGTAVLVLFFFAVGMVFGDLCWSLVLEPQCPRKHDQIHDHELAPLIRKKWWTQLGRLLNLSSMAVHWNSTSLDMSRYVSIHRSGSKQFIDIYCIVGDVYLEHHLEKISLHSGDVLSTVSLRTSGKTHI